MQWGYRFLSHAQNPGRNICHFSMDCSWSPSVELEDLKRSFDSVTSVDDFYFKWEKLCESSGRFPEIDTETETYSMGKGCGIITAVCNELGTGEIRRLDPMGQEYEPIHVKEGEAHSLFCQALSDDSIIVLSSDLRCRYYQDGKCMFKQGFPEFRDVIIEKVVFDALGNAVILLTDGRLLKFTLKSNVSKCLVSFMTQVEMVGKVEHMAIMYDSASLVTVFLVDESGKLLMVTEGKTEKYSVDFGEKISLIACSESSSCLAILLEDDTLIVSDCFLTYELYRTSLSDCYFSNPRKMVWIGDTAPVIAYDSGCVLGSEGECHPFWVFEIGKAPVIFGDLDCAMVFTEGGVYRLLEVPANVINVLSNEETEGYKLCVAFSNRLTQPPVQALRRIRIARACDEIGKTVPYMRTSEVHKVQSEKDILECCKYQMFIIDALVFGAQFCEAVNTDYLIKKITIMNILFFVAKVPITSRQIDDIGFTALTRRLSSRGNHFLAVRLCELIGASTVSIARDYVHYTIDSIREDTACKTLLVSEPYSDIHYAVGYALRMNRLELARMLCEERTDTPKRAMLFAQMGDWTSAFRTVTETGNMDELHALLLLVSSMHSRNIQTTLLSNFIAESEMAVMYLSRNPDLVSPEMMTSVMDSIDDKSSLADVKVRFELQTEKRTTIVPTLDKLQKGLKVTADFLHDDSIASMTRNQLLRKLILEENQEALRVFVEAAEIPRDVVDSHVFRVFADKAWPRFIEHAVGKGIANVELALHIAFARKRDDVAQSILARIDERKAEGLRQLIDAGEFRLADAPSFANLFSSGSLITKVAMRY